MAGLRTHLITSASALGASLIQKSWVRGTALKSLIQGTGVSLTDNGDSITISSTGGSSSSTNVFYPETYGAKGDAFGAHDGVASGSTFSSVIRPFIAADVGKRFWAGGDWSINRTIMSVNAGVATLSSAVPPGTGLLYLLGTDDTAAVQAALDAAAAVSPLPYNTEPYFSEDQGKITGGVVYLTPGKTYGITNSQASYVGGKLSCLTIHRRTSLQGAADGQHRSGLLLFPSSYGHMISNLSPTSYSDFIDISNLSLYGYGIFSPNGLDGIHLEIPTGQYPSTDPFNRVRNVFVSQTTRDGFYFKGKGELMVSGNDANGCGRHGFFFDNVYDTKASNNNAGGNSKNGFKIDSTGACIFTNNKSYYSGSGGGSVARDCANWCLLGNQEGGLVSFGNCMAQESRGSSWHIESGNNVFTGCQAYDPGRVALAGGTLPSNMAGWALVGVGCRMNTFSDCVVGPSATIYDPSSNIGANVDSVNIDGVDGNGAGPQLNQGNIYTYRVTTNAGGGSSIGTTYSGTGAVKRGGGISNGKNTGLRIDGVALT